MALTKGDKIICADVIAKDFIMRSGNEQDVNFDLKVIDDENRSEFDIGSSGIIYRSNEKANSNSVDIDIDCSRALIQINQEYDGGDVHSTNSLELSAYGSYLRNKNTYGDVGELCIKGEELTFNGHKVFVDDGDTYLVTNETSSVDSVTEMYIDRYGNGKPAHFGCLSGDVGDDIGIGSDGVYLFMPYGGESENYGHIIAGDDECNAGDASLYHAALDGDGGIGSWRRILDSSNYTDYIGGASGAVVGHKDYTNNRYYDHHTLSNAQYETMMQEDFGYDYVINGKHISMTIYGRSYASYESRRINYTLPFTIKNGYAYTVQLYGCPIVTLAPDSSRGSVGLYNTNKLPIDPVRYKPSSYQGLCDFQGEANGLTYGKDKFVIVIEGTLV